MERNIEVARAAVRLAISGSRQEENDLKKAFLDGGIRTAAVDFGGEYLASLPKIVERAMIAAKRERVIKEGHLYEGAVAGATREALSEMARKALGFNVGGKVGIAAAGEHLNVAVFIGVGLLHLDDAGIALSHRAVPVD